MKSWCVALLILMGAAVYAQDPVKLIDSLKIELAKNPRDEARAKIYADLTWYYAMVSTDSAVVYGDKALALAGKLGDSVFLAQALNDYGTVNFVRGEFNTSIKQFKQSLAIRKNLKDTLGQAAVYSKMGNSYYRKAQFDSTMSCYLNALRIFEKKDRIQEAGIVRSNIASLYLEMKDYNKALTYNKESVDFFKEHNLREQQANSVVNTGIAHLFLKDTLAAEKSFKEAIELGEKIAAARPLGAAYNNLANIYMGRGEYTRARRAIIKSIEQRGKLGMLSLVESSRITLAQIETALGNHREAYTLLLDAKNHVDEQEYNEKLPMLYGTMVQVHAAMANLDSVSHYNNLLLEVYNKKSERQIQEVTAEMDAKYETEKKENQILAQRAEIAEKELQVKRKDTQLYGSIGFILVLAVITYLIYNQQKLKNRQLKKENELKVALAKIETQNRLQEQRLRISRDLHDNIGSQLTFIISSIDNLSYALSEKNEKITEKLSSISKFTASTINELRDTIWAMNKEEISFEDLETRISNFIERARAVTRDIEFRFVKDQEVAEGLVFSSLEGINIYRIIQEAVNNALKYASAQTITVNISGRQPLKISIVDDGRGFDLVAHEPGNGLLNMQRRARDVGGELSVDSAPGRGTTVDLLVRLRENPSA